MHIKLLEKLNRTEKDNLQFNPITEQTWLDFYQKLWTKQPIDNITERKIAKLTETCVDLI
jgi:protoheme ferro-lyase